MPLPELCSATGAPEPPVLPSHRDHRNTREHTVTAQNTLSRAQAPRAGSQGCHQPGGHCHGHRAQAQKATSPPAWHSCQPFPRLGLWGLPSTAAKSRLSAKNWHQEQQQCPGSSSEENRGMQSPGVTAQLLPHSSQRPACSTPGRKDKPVKARPA